MKFFTLMVVLLAASSSVEAGRRRKKVNAPVVPPVSAATAKVNDPVCVQIKNTWWNIRENDKTRAAITAWDAKCDAFTNDMNACITATQAARAAYIGNQITAQEAEEVRCAMTGGKDRSCISNPCNHLNDGQCTLEGTGGLCVWHTKEDAQTYASFGVQYGCFRNPCHMGGSGKVSDQTCEARSIPNYMQCTYCAGPRDPEILGLGIGCQLTTLTKAAGCENIAQGNVNEASIWQKVGKKNTKCLCSDEESPFCADAIVSRAAEYKPFVRG